MRCLVTGATGFIGSRLVEKLLDSGYSVNVLVRTPDKLGAPIRDKVQVFTGHILDRDAIALAIQQCSTVFHLAAFAGIWSKDIMLPWKINVDGTNNILEAALKYNIQKVVFTSSAGTLAPSVHGREVDEDTPLPDTYHTSYERSKVQAEQLCHDFYRRGLNVVVVNPTRVFGPGPLNKSNSVTLLVKKYLNGSWRFIPGSGEYIGNYVFIDDVVAGHIQAMNSGNGGEKYILGGINISFNEFFRQLSIVGNKNYKLFHIPYPFIQSLSYFELFRANITGKNPLITPPWARRYRENRLVSNKKAIENLGYEITPLPEALEKTIRWLKFPASLNAAGSGVYHPD